MIPPAAPFRLRSPPRILSPGRRSPAARDPITLSRCNSMRTIRFAALAAGAALALVPGAPAAAQPSFPTLAPGQSVAGSFAESDPALSRNGRFRVYQLRAEPGRRYVAWMRSGDFDAYLSLARTVGGITDFMREDDDGGEGTDARLRFTVPAAGTYLLIAQSLHADGTGAFTLGLDTLQVRPAAVRDLTLGQPIRGELTESDAELDEDEGFYQLFRFRGRAGQRVRARTESEEFGTLTEVGMMDGDAFIPLEGARSEFGGVALATLPRDGTYYVRAGGWGGGGPYTLFVEERVAATVRPQPLRRGTDVAGALGPGDADLDDGRWYDAYSFTGTAGERVTVTLRSDDFDAYLFLGRVVNGEFQEMDRNDDHSEEDGVNSRIDFALPADGEYVVQATSFGAGGEGAYVLRVQP